MEFGMTREEEILEEGKKMRMLRLLTDLTMNVLWQQNMSLEEAYELVAAMKERILDLFPDKLETYDLLLKPRFDRVIREKFRIN
jgi:hypothetical protein